MNKELGTHPVLEIGDSVARLCFLKSAGQSVELVDMQSFDLAGQDDVEKSFLLKEGLSRLSQKVNPLDKNITLVFFGSQVIIKTIELPQMPKEELKEAVPWSLKEELPYPIEEASFDYKVIDETKDAEGNVKLSLVCCAIRKEIIRKYTTILTELDLSPVAILARPFCIAEIINRSQSVSQDLCQVMVDIGFECTDISFYKNNNLLFSRQIPLAAKSINEAITGAFVAEKGKIELTDVQASKFIENHGIPKDEVQLIDERITGAQVLGILRPTLEQLAGEIRRSMLYFRSNFKERLSDQVYITGSGACIKGLVEFLDRSLQLNVEKLKLPSEVNISEALSQQANLPLQVSGCLGAVLNTGNIPDFLPQEFKLKEKRKIVIISLRIAAVALGVALLFSLVTTATRININKAKLKSIQSQFVKFQQVSKIYAGILAFNGVRQYALEGRIPPIWIMKELSSLMPKEVTLYNMRLDCKGNKLILAGTVKAAPKDVQIVLAKFMGKLKDSLFFKKPHLSSTRKSSSEGRNAIDFQIDCGIEDVKGLLYGI